MANKASTYCGKYPCNQVATNGAYCNEHTPAKAPKETDAIYLSTRWRRFRDWYIGKYPLCSMCLSEGREVPGAVVDHVRELRDGGAETSEENAMTLCHWHHNNKTADAKNHRKGTGSNPLGTLTRDFRFDGI